MLGSGKVTAQGAPTSKWEPEVTKRTLRVYCFDAKPWKRIVNEQPGTVVPQAKLLRINMGHQQDAEAEFEQAFQTIAQAVLAGDWVLLHDRTGTQGAAAMAVITKAVIDEQSMEDAISAISEVRALEFSQMLRHYNQIGWYRGDFKAWMCKYIEAAQRTWKVTWNMREGVSAIAPSTATPSDNNRSRPRNQSRSAWGASYYGGSHSTKHKSNKHHRHRRG